MKFLKELLVVSAIWALLSQNLYAQWWRSEPKDFNECILKNVKSGMSGDAVDAVKYACYAKFPQALGGVEKADEKSKAKRYERCGLEGGWRDSLQYLTIESANPSRTTQVLGKIKEVGFQKVSGVLEFQNSNDFAIRGLMLGLTSSKSCHNKLDLYQFTTYCRAVESVVSANSYGKLQCGSLPSRARALGVCVVGYSPNYSYYGDDFLEFLESNKYCSL